MITDIKRKGKSEVYNVFVDGEFYGLFEGEILYRYKIKIGTDFDANQLKQYKLESDEILCFSMVIGYVSKYLKTEKATKDYLKKYLFSDNAIESAINKLKSYGYLNDKYFAKAYGESLSNSKGSRYIKNKLREKGVSDENIREVLEELQDEDVALEGVIKKWLKGKNFPLDKKDKDRLYRHLIGRGFGFESIKKALNKFGDLEGLNEDWYWYTGSRENKKGTGSWKFFEQNTSS